ncbi:MAG TPA: hypothetical protein VKP88_03980 [Candidatus Paceibacterota bacterium]|nr:hypothetical protein [Candidatus Paceibacterota bacterium]
MLSTKTTNSVRRMLESCGAVRPGIRAVRMVAKEMGSDGQTRHWEVTVPRDIIVRAVEASSGYHGDASYEVFRRALASETMLQS